MSHELATKPPLPQILEPYGADARLPHSARIRIIKGKWCTADKQWAGWHETTFKERDKKMWRKERNPVPFYTKKAYQRG